MKNNKKNNNMMKITMLPKIINNIKIYRPTICTITYV